MHKIKINILLCPYVGTTTTRSSSSIYNCLPIELKDSIADDTSTCISCTLANMSVGTCVVVVHPKPSSFIHNSFRGLQDIDVIHLNKSTSDNTCSGCIDGISLDDHVVAVFLYHNGTIISGSHAFVQQKQSTYTGIHSYSYRVLLSCLISPCQWRI